MTRHDGAEPPDRAHAGLSRELRLELQSGDTRMGAGASLSVATHVVVAVLVFAVLRYAPEPERIAFLPQRSPDAIVWIPQPGPGGGGGGGGDPTPAPPTELEIPGEDEIAVPVAEPAESEITEPEPLDQSFAISALMMNAGQTLRPGMLEAEQASANVSRGAGLGTGIGEGEGDGLGEGTGGGFGGGAFRPGNGVELPQVLRRVNPRYTAEAMRAQIQGTVLLECVVLADGSVGEVRVVRSLDDNFGLDEEAVSAARQWEFAPGTRFGEPVAVLVTIELNFNIR
jgi:protein TonB